MKIKQRLKTFNLIQTLSHLGPMEMDFKQSHHVWHLK
jgi:hypothetical protein